MTGLLVVEQEASQAGKDRWAAAARAGREVLERIQMLDNSPIGAVDAILDLERDNVRLRDGLRQAAARFREYEALHAAKPDPVKAERNGDMAAMLERLAR